MKQKILIPILLFFLFQNVICFGEHHRHKHRMESWHNNYALNKNVDDNFFSKYQTIAAALLATLMACIGFIVNSTISRNALNKQYRHKYLLENKQKWVDDFKDLVSEYDSSITILSSFLVKYGHIFKSNLTGEEEEINTLNRLMTNTIHLNTKISLHIYNKEEQINKNFLSSLEKLNENTIALLNDNKNINQKELYDFKKNMKDNASLIIQIKIREIEQFV